MKKRVFALVALTSVGLWAATEKAKVRRDPEKSDPATVRVDFAQAVGPVKPMNAVNNGPVGGGGTWRHETFEAYKAARFPFARTHDASESIFNGGDHVVDITAVFPNFDADESKPANYDFTITDAFLKRMRAAGTEPFYRLGQRIEHREKRYNIYPPKDFAKWARIAEHVIRHYNEGWADGYRWNIRYWEIWNEPDNDLGWQEKKELPRMWGGTEEQFFSFFETVAKHLKGKFPELRIGGPATCGKIAFHERFFAYQQKHATPMDFFSWHIYSTNPRMLTRKADKVREQMTRYGYGDKESILNEWNYMKGWTGHYYASMVALVGQTGAAFAAASMCACQAAPVDMLMYYDAQPTASHNGLFDRTTMQPTKPYYALYSWSRLALLGTTVAARSDAEDVFVTAARADDGRKAIFVVRYCEDANETLVKPVTLKLAKGRFPAEVTTYVTDETRMHTQMPAWPTGSELRLFLPPNTFTLIEYKD